MVPQLAYFLVYDPEDLKEEILRVFPDSFEKMKTYHKVVIANFAKFNNLQQASDTEIYIFLNPEIAGIIHVGDQIIPPCNFENKESGPTSPDYIPPFMPTYMYNGKDQTYLWNTGGGGDDYTIRVIDRRIDLDNEKVTIVLKSVFF